MPKVDVKIVCRGPVAPETKGGTTTLERQGLCRDVIEVSYNDDFELEEKMFNALHGSILCEKCGKQAQQLRERRDKAKRDALKNWRGGRKSSKKSKDLMF
tara:strand:- start:365 stop:664 length:300 start_codon:yes stop_codon:yes gene_type:complete